MKISYLNQSLQYNLDDRLHNLNTLTQNNIHHTEQRKAQIILKEYAQSPQGFLKILSSLFERKLKNYFSGRTNP